MVSLTGSYLGRPTDFNPLPLENAIRQWPEQPVAGRIDGGRLLNVLRPGNSPGTPGIDGSHIACKWGKQVLRSRPWTGRLVTDPVVFGTGSTVIFSALNLALHILGAAHTVKPAGNLTPSWPLRP